MMKVTDIPIKDAELLSHELEQQLVLVQPLSGKVKVINQVGTFIWSQIDGCNEIESIIASVVGTFSVNNETATRDVLAFLSELRIKGLITLRD